nr:basic proline-rich protein-like [Aegilops tauschii subsp. strangulata]
MRPSPRRRLRPAPQRRHRLLHLGRLCPRLGAGCCAATPPRCAVFPAPNPAPPVPGRLPRCQPASSRAEAPARPPVSARPPAPAQADYSPDRLGQLLAPTCPVAASRRVWPLPQRHAPPPGRLRASPPPPRDPVAGSRGFPVTMPTAPSRAGPACRRGRVARCRLPASRPPHGRLVSPPHGTCRRFHPEQEARLSSARQPASGVPLLGAGCCALASRLPRWLAPPQPGRRLLPSHSCRLLRQ